MALTYEPITTTTLGTASASITLSSIPGTYTDLRVVLGNLRFASSGQGCAIRFNGDTGTNYSYMYNFGDSSGTSISYQASQSTPYITGWPIDSNNSGYCIVDIFNYAGSTNKTYLSDSGYGAGFAAKAMGMWRNSAAITSITLLPTASINIAVGTTVTIYGIKAA